MQHYTFDRTKNGWFLRLTNMHDVDVWNKNIYTKLFEKAAANLMIGKEYKNFNMDHGPNSDVAAISDCVYLRAQIEPIHDLTQTETAMAYLLRLWNNTIVEIKRQINKNNIVHVSKAGGYHIANIDNILETIEDTNFPNIERNNKNEI